MGQSLLSAVVLGASGYAGVELVRLLAGHPSVTVSALSADSNAGKTLGEMYGFFAHYSGSSAPAPHPSPTRAPLAGAGHGVDNSPAQGFRATMAQLAAMPLVRTNAIDYTGVDVVFAALPHGASATTMIQLLEQWPHLRVIDLSADFRLESADVYEAWYGITHPAPDALKTAVYGLSEFSASAMPNAQLVANPGCYPTTVCLPLLPLLANRAINPDHIVIDAKSGVSGAGRGAKPNLLLADLHSDFYPYGTANLHRHRPEIEQVLHSADSRVTSVTFQPHLLPIPRGMLASIYGRFAPEFVVPADNPSASQDKTLARAHALLSEAFAATPFVTVLPLGQTPTLAAVRGTNHCVIGLCGSHDKGGKNTAGSSFVDDRFVIFSAIDNLIKGASGQAVQNMNLMYGFAETEGLDAPPVFP
ncbi:MAG: N-acetyl-gamma-glutamyl-phosphate reductase [Alphaproteobacteria bacterium]|nr:N-acetyl-gamma-glutamyl-phosphate reductase [Alphaproteobacteria bacterium]